MGNGDVSGWPGTKLVRAMDRLKVENRWIEYWTTLVFAFDDPVLGINW